MYPKKQLAQLVISACQYFKIDTVVLSPGSRNAPLTIGFSNHPEIKSLSVVDERCAAFFAMGIAQQTQKTIAIVCTSGSALLNYYPAIAEAFYSKIPLLVISADRPSYKIDVGDGQTICQDNVFNRHIGYAANLRQDIIHAIDKIKRYRPNWIVNKKEETLQKEVQEFNDNFDVQLIEFNKKRN